MGLVCDRDVERESELSEGTTTGASPTAAEWGLHEKGKHKRPNMYKSLQVTLQRVAVRRVLTTVNRVKAYAMS